MHRDSGIGCHIADYVVRFVSEVAHFGDACACATALLECDGELLSFDQRLSRITGIVRSETV